MKFKKVEIEAVDNGYIVTVVANGEGLLKELFSSSRCVFNKFNDVVIYIADDNYPAVTESLVVDNKAVTSDAGKIEFL